ncbi:MAG: Fur family transcriptional regulator [Candidatus Caldatribacteriaceae bacterium]
MTKFRERWQRVFELSRKKITPSREAIVELLQESGKHLSAEEIYIYLKEKQKEVGIATVYRNLELLSQMGIVHRVNFGDGKEHYEIAQIPTLHHHHLVCTSCGKVIDYQDFQQEENFFVERLGRALEKKYEFLVQSHQLYFYGLCKECCLREVKE